MHVDVRKAGDVLIVDLEGKLVAGVMGDELLRAVINELLAEGWAKILLNMDKVSAIDSAGVGELASSIKLAERFEVAMKVLRPGDRVRRVLHLSQVLPLLEVYEDEAEAIKSFDV